MQVLSHTGNQVFIGHFQGGAIKNYLDEVAALSLNKVSVSSLITVLTTFEQKENAITALQLDSNQIPYINTFKYIGGRWSNVNKIELYVEQLEQVQTPYSLLLDAHDVLIFKDLDEEFINKFKSFDKKVIFNATKNNYPNITVDHVENRDQLGEFKYLNAGVVFGETSYLLALYKEILSLVRNKQIVNPWDSEQFYVRLVANGKNEVTFDSSCVLFQTFAKTNKVNLGNTLIIT